MSKEESRPEDKEEMDQVGAEQIERRGQAGESFRRQKSLACSPMSLWTIALWC